MPRPMRAYVTPSGCSFLCLPVPASASAAGAPADGVMAPDLLEERAAVLFASGSCPGRTAQGPDWTSHGPETERPSAQDPQRPGSMPAGSQGCERSPRTRSTGSGPASRSTIVIEVTPPPSCNPSVRQLSGAIAKGRLLPRCHALKGRDKADLQASLAAAAALAASDKMKPHHLSIPLHPGRSPVVA